MSKGTIQNDTPIIAGATVRLYSRSPVNYRLQQLSKLVMPTFAERAELAALITLRVYGQVTASDLWDTLRIFHNIGENITIDYSEENSQWLSSIGRDMQAAWRNLRLLEVGEYVGLPEEQESEEAEQI